MNRNLFDYIFGVKRIAQSGQPLQVLTTAGELVTGIFIKAYEQATEKLEMVEIIEVELPNFQKRFLKHDDVINLRLSFIKTTDKNIKYTTIEMVSYFEAYNRVVLKLKDGAEISGYLTSWPEVFGNFPSDIAILQNNGQTRWLDLYDILSLDLYLEDRPFDNSLTYYEKEGKYKS